MSDTVPQACDVLVVQNDLGVKRLWDGYGLNRKRMGSNEE